MGDRSERASAWPLYMVGGLFVLAALLIAAWNVELPYLAFSAGPVSDAADSIRIDGAEVYPPEGELLMLTVVSQGVNLFEVAIAGLDPTIDLVSKEAYRRPDESDEDYRRRVLQQMDDSQQRAVTVALEFLGYQMIPQSVVVTDVVAGKPAAEVLRIGDIIKALDDIAVIGGDDLTSALDGYQPGDVVQLTVIRDGAEQALPVELATRDDDPSRPMIGIVIGEVTIPPFPVSIDAGNVGGPSAGLMYTLSIIEELGAGELTKGRVVAGTGTIQYDGTVGAIGGVRQKVVAAEAGGAAYMLVPESNYQEALTAERGDMEIVAVATLEDAISFLDGLPSA